MKGEKQGTSGARGLRLGRGGLASAAYVLLRCVGYAAAGKLICRWLTSKTILKI